VDRFLHLLSQHQLFLKQSKCAFGALDVEYLGHLVGKDGIRVDLKKIEAMQDWMHPKTLKILRGFLGLTRYYRKFVKNYGKIATPLTALLKKNSFTWTPIELWPSPTRNYLKGIWENPSMKRKCWLFYMPLICGALISWGNVSKLR
jgi:hypothetical protein